MALLTKAQILSAADRPYRDVEAWGGTVRLQAMTALEAQRFAKLIGEDDDQARLIVLALCIVDENGEQVFELADIEELGCKGWATILRLSDIAFELNKRDADVKAAEKNF